MSNWLKFNLWQWFKGYRVGGPGNALTGLLDRLIALLKIPAPDTPQLVRRITIMERDIVLPIKAAGIAMLLQSFYFTPWIGIVSGTLDVAVESVQYFFWLYVLVNVVMASLLLSMRWLPLALIEWAVFFMSLVDGVFLGALTLVTGGYNSILYWLFLGLVARSAVSVPRATSQLMLNLTLIGCFVLAGVIDVSVAVNLDETNRRVLDLPDPLDSPAEPLLLRLVLLLLMTVCCYGVQVLSERHRRVVEEAREFAMREGQLRSAGRLAAEIAHQIKNPLAIINNAAFSLRRALKEGRTDALEQIQIIQEEVERSDRIITQIMGYAQLSEGRVEKLNVIEEIESALTQVFPPAAQYRVKIHRDYAPQFPPLLMQRRHASDAFTNLLQNAREALDGREGNIFVSAQCRSDYAIEVSIKDDGPGIPAHKQEKIFEAYYTTKEKGTGIGLATVKHNVELYGGEVRVESELGKGTRFILSFPGRTLIKLESQNVA
jgi:signal transduction histidine kinase